MCVGCLQLLEHQHLEIDQTRPPTAVPDLPSRLLYDMIVHLSYRADIHDLTLQLVNHCTALCLRQTTRDIYFTSPPRPSPSTPALPATLQLRPPSWPTLRLLHAGYRPIVDSPPAIGATIALHYFHPR